MNIVLKYWRLSAVMLLFTVLSACVVPGGGVYGGGASYVGGYYEPVGYAYGGWGPGYQVGPSRCCVARPCGRLPTLIGRRPRLARLHRFRHARVRHTRLGTET